MSPYFTSPPPVYARNWANGQNLVESTKIKRQIVASKKVHRKEKRGKKEEKKQKNAKSLKQQYFPSNRVFDESEQLEKSCLTDEHEQHHHVGYLSDGSQSSKKRVREASPAVESKIKATPVAGNPLRIRFVFKKPKEAERPSEISTAVSGSKTCNYDENLLSPSLGIDQISILSESKKRKKYKPSKESRHNTLFDEWLPPCNSLEVDNSNNDDWLFSSRQQLNASIKNDEDMIMNFQTSGDCSSLPRARFLSEVRIFSLPYTVPF